MLRNLGRNNQLIMLAIFVWALSTGLWFNQRQLYLCELGATPEQIGMALALESIASAVVLIPAGLIADRIGPRRVIIAAWLLGLAGTALMALAKNWQAVVPGLMVQRMCSAANPALVAFVLLSLPNRDLPETSEKTLTTVFGAWPAAQVLSPMLGGIIAEKSAIRTDLWIAFGGFAFGLMVILLTKHVESGERDSKAHSGMLLRNQAFLLLAGFYTLTMVALFAGYVLVPNFLQEVRGFSLTTIGILFSIFSAGAVVFNLVAGRIDLRRSFAGLLVVSWLGFLGLWQTSAVGGAVVAFFMLGGISTMWAVMNAGIARVVREQNQGQAFGVMESLVFVASAIASWMAGQLYDLTPAHDLPLIAGLVSIPVMLAIWFHMPMAPLSASARSRAVEGR